MKKNFAWHLERIRAMSPSEIAHRIAFERRKQQWRRRPPRGATPLHFNLPEDTISALCLPSDETEKKALVADAEKILHRGTLDWHKDDLSGKSAPLRFSLDIDYRDANAIGDAKTIWEKSRHHHLTVLAVAYALTKDERYATAVANQLLDWSARNPFLQGINWSHALEAGIRLIAWVWCERLLRDSVHHDRLNTLWPVIHQHQQFIEHARSRGSSANNHLIGEMAGLFIAATAWPVFAESARWRALARQSLEEEIIRQTFPSGLNREMAFSYHIFTFEFFLFAWLENPSVFSAAYVARLRRMAGVISALADCAPNYGDCDDGHALKLRAGNVWLRQLCGETPTTTEDAGLFVLRHDNIAVLADAGLHGYLSIAAHAHADALAFILTIGGQPIFIDSGTYDYFRSEQDRRYFRSTRAHNTIVVDSLDQSTQAGPFLWSRQAKTTVESWDGTTLTASHDGYRGIIHRRRFALRRGVLEISDTLEGSGEHEATLYFHLAPECAVNRDTFEITCGNVRVRMSLPVKAEATEGWYSPRFGVKKECVAIVARWHGTLPVTLTTTLEIST